MRLHPLLKSFYSILFTTDAIAYIASVCQTLVRGFVWVPAFRHHRAKTYGISLSPNLLGGWGSFAQCDRAALYSERVARWVAGINPAMTVREVTTGWEGGGSLVGYVLPALHAALS
jgi:hypothetical protein